ncbi:hypothetical protein ACB092_12G199300 [Castanea dentata]
MREKPIGDPRGFGFVVFSDPSVLDRVLQDRHTINGRTGVCARASTGMVAVVSGHRNACPIGKRLTKNIFLF